MPRDAGSPPRRLAVYGSLRTDGGNHARIADFGPPIAVGTARGTIAHVDGYPVFTPDERGEDVAFEVYESPLLTEERLAELDAWEGAEYRRSEIVVRCDDGTSMSAMTYATARSGS